MAVSKQIDEQVSFLDTPVLLLSVSPVAYQEGVMETLKYFSDRFGKGLYITLNKPTATLRKVFEMGGVPLERIVFLDSITSTPEKNTASAVFLGKMSELSDLALAISNLVLDGQGVRFVFFDSVSTLLIYNDAKSVTRFCHLIAEKMRKWGMPGAFVSVDMHEGTDMVAQLAQFCDAYVKGAS